MANLVQLRMLEDLNGIVLVDKPAGIAFTSVVKAVKRKFNLVKVGHGGSLDAMASGLLVLLVNDANRKVEQIMGADRSYAGTMRMGLKTNTHDIHGEKIGGSDPSCAGEALESALKEFKGDIFQREPRFCSVRREGSAGYEIADTGEHADFLSHVYRIRLTREDASLCRVGFEISCTKSLIVRTLVNDFGDVVGCGACLESLRRTRIGNLDVSQAIAFDKLLETEIRDFPGCVLPLTKALP